MLSHEKRYIFVTLMLEGHASIFLVEFRFMRHIVLQCANEKYEVAKEKCEVKAEK